VKDNVGNLDVDLDSQVGRLTTMTVLYSSGACYKIKNDLNKKRGMFNNYQIN